MGSDTAILVVEAVVGLSIMVLLAAAANHARPPEDICDQCGARNPIGGISCRTCRKPMKPGG